MKQRMGLMLVLGMLVACAVEPSPHPPSAAATLLPIAATPTSKPTVQRFPPGLAGVNEVPDSNWPRAGLARYYGEYALSPDGGKIAAVFFRSEEEASADLFVIDVVAGEWQQLSGPPTASLVQPFWSPDGQVVGFHAQNGDFMLERGIWLANTDSTERRFFAGGHLAAWSADGQRIASVSAAGLGENSYLAIHMLDVVTGQGEEIFRTSAALDWGAGLAWSPDEHDLALAWGEPLGQTAKLFLLDLNTSEVIPLSGEGGYGWIKILGWTSDGEWLATVANQEGYFVRRDGTCWVQPSVLEDYRWLAFSGESNRLLVSYGSQFYIVSLREALGPGFPESVLSCP
jgi:hypothetical protein